MVATRPPLRLALAVAAVLGAAGASHAGDVPVLGSGFWISVPQQQVQFVSYDTAIQPPFADPASGASLVLHGSNAPGQCHGEIPLPAAHWSAVPGGHRYRDPSASQGGIQSVLLRRGRLFVLGTTAGWPCDVSASSQTLPIQVELRVGGPAGDRYCAAFGGSVIQNQPGSLLAWASDRPESCLDDDLTVANLNILHGSGCDVGGPTNFCRASDRIALLADWIAASGCPDVVTLQEVFQLPPVLDAPAEIAQAVAGICPFEYTLFHALNNNLDDQLFLSRYPILDFEDRGLHRGFRSATWVRVDHPVGAVDVVSTHLASGSDGGPDPCDAAPFACPPECIAENAVTTRDCQAIQTALLMEEKHDGDAPAVVTGDMNAEPGSFVHQVFTGRGWLDTHLAAGNAECDPGSGAGCTSGREDTNLSELEVVASNQDRRIDFTFLVPPGAASVCTGQLDPATDDDGDGSATRIFADDPNPFDAACGALPAAICWPSDHEGSEMDLGCR